MTTTDRGANAPKTLAIAGWIVGDLLVTALSVLMVVRTIEHSYWLMTLAAILAFVLPGGEEGRIMPGLSVWIFGIGLWAAVDHYNNTHLLAAWVFGMASFQIFCFATGWIMRISDGVRAWKVRPKMAQRQIIGLAGYAGSGKDTAAAALVADGWIRVAFADKLKRVAYDLNPLVVFGGQVERLQFVVDTYGWEIAKREPDVRGLLQRLGTDAVRQHLGADVWVDAAFSDLPPDANVVITDVRFPNEVASIRSAGGAVVRVTRPGVDAINGHKSESALTGMTPDATVTNGSTVEDLHAAMLETAEELAGERRASRR